MHPRAYGVGTWQIHGEKLPKILEAFYKPSNPTPCLICYYCAGKGNHVGGSLMTSISFVSLDVLCLLYSCS